jgi:hypothetical protein
MTGGEFSDSAFCHGALLLVCGFNPSKQAAGMQNSAAILLLEMIIPSLV